MSTGAPLRQPIPVGRSILWSPASAGADRPDDVSFPIFFSQAALTAIHEHIATPHRPGQGILGFLLGDLCECPDTNVSYLVIDLALRLNQPIYGDRTRDVVTRLWDPIQGQLEEQRAHLLGWYHTHPPQPLVLSDHDVETHEHYFAERWQVALLLAPDAAEPGGAFFRAGGDDTWVSTPLPFYELLGDDSIRPDGKKRSFMAWKDYRAFHPASPAAAGRGVEGPAPNPVAPPPRRPPAPSGPRFTPPPRSAPAPAPPPPADAGELKFLTAAEDMPPPLPPSPPRPERASRPAPPSPRPAPEPRDAPPPEPEAPMWPEEFADTEQAAEPEALEEAPAPPPRVRRRRRPMPRGLRRALWLMLLGATAAGAYWWLGPRLPLPSVSKSTIANTWSALSDKWSALTDQVSTLTGKLAVVVKRLRRPAPAPPRPASGASRPQPGPVPHAPAPPAVAPTTAPASGAARQLDQVGDTVSRAVRGFTDRFALFGRGQVACPDLARSLAAVERRWIAYNAARRGSGTLDAARAARDQTLYAGVDSVERRFEQSGCQRP